MQEQTQLGPGRQGTAAPGRGLPGRLVLVLYALEPNDSPVAWKIQLVGGQLHAYRAVVLSDVWPDAIEFKEVVASRTDNRFNEFKISRIYKVELEDDRAGGSGPVLILETLPNSSSLTCSRWTSEGGNTWFREFEFKGPFSAILSDSVEALWYFHARVENGLKWDRFGFSANLALGSNGFASNSKSTVVFLPAASSADQSIGGALYSVAKLGEVVEQNNINVWELAVTGRNGAGFMGAQPCEDFCGDFYLPSTTSTTVLVCVDMVEVAWIDHSRAARDQDRTFLTLRLRAIFDKTQLDHIDLKGYGNIAPIADASTNLKNTAALLATALGLLRDNKLMYHLNRAEAAQVQMAARPAGALKPGPVSSGTPMSGWKPGAAYSPSRKVTFEFRHIPTRFFVDSWDQMVRRFHLDLNRTQRGNAVSMLPLFEPSSGDGGGYPGGWTIYYNLVDRNRTWAASGKYALLAPGVTSDDRLMRTAALHSMHPDVGPKFELSGSFPQLNGIWQRGGITNLRVPLAGGDPTDLWNLDDNERGLRFNLSEAIYVQPGSGPNAVDPRIRFGSFDLFLYAAKTPLRAEDLSSRRARLDIGPAGQVIVETALSVAMRNWSPGGQDADRALEYPPLNFSSGANDARCEAGFVDIPAKMPPSRVDIGPKWEQMFASEVPVLIYRPASSVIARTARYVLDATEGNYDQYSHSLDLKVRTNGRDNSDLGADACHPDKPENLESVLILVRNPFLAAKVAFNPLSASQQNDPVIASWTNRADQNVGWQLRFNTTQKTVSPVCLTLPSQTMGESMLKERPADKEKQVDIPAEEFAKYNLGPNATIAMDVTADGTAYTAAPWNLQELTNKPNLAPAIKQMDYELLYGLSCNSKAPFLRLVELFGRIGAIPGQPKAEIAWKNDLGGYKEQVAIYHKWRIQWAWIYRRYLNRLAIFEAANYGTNPDLPAVVLKNPTLSCWFRLPDASNLMPPVTLDKSDVTDPMLTRLQTGKLGGGATWGFSSKNVYIASVLDTDKQVARLSSSAELSEFAFSSLGMYGKQMAGFQNDLTKIYADAHLGRVYRYKVERQGRIAVFWNVAKHVVVFERRVAPAPQFEGKQQPMLGAPVLRIVEEYVEVVNERQDFPHPTETAKSTTDPDAMARRRGCVTGIQFAPGARFYVSSEWGSDVGKFGWKIPLWKPGASPAASYPKPKFDLRMAPQDKTAKEVERQCFARPEQVYFFTLTKMGPKEDDPDPDPQKWPPIEGVDYSDFPEPKPLTDFTDGDPRQYTAPDRLQPVGFGPCTFELEPAASPVNLMESRMAAPMAVQLRSVTLGRCVGRENTLQDQATAVKSPELAIAELQRGIEQKLTDIFKDLLKEFPANKIFQPGLKDRILNDVWTKVDAKFAALNTEIDDIQKKLEAAYVANLTKTIAGVETQASARVLDRIKAEVEAAVKRAKDRIAQIQNTATDIDARGKALIQDCGAEVAEKLLLCGSLPGRYTRFMMQIADRIASYTTEADTEIRGILDRLQAAVNAPKAAIADCRGAATAEIERLGRIEDQVLAPTRDWMPPEIPSAAAKLQGELANYVGVASLLANSLLDPALKNAAEFTAKISEIRNGPLFKTLQNPAQMLVVFNKYSGANIAAANWTELVGNAKKSVSSTTAKMVDAWGNAVTAATKDAFTTTSQITAAVDKLAEAVTTATGLVQAELVKLTTQATAQVTKAKDLFAGGVDLLKAQIQAARNNAHNLFLQAAGEAGELEKQIQKCRDEAVGKARDWCEQSAGPLLADVKAKSPGLFQAGDTAMRLVKAFGDPPKTAQLAFERSQAGYYFKQAAPGVDLSPIMSVLDQGAAVVDALKPLGLKLPCAGITDQLIPPSLKNFDLNQIIGNFAGIDLKHLLDGFKLPDGVDGDKIKVTHEIDQRQKRAYARAAVNFDIDKTAVILDFGPIRLELPKATFKAFMEMSVGLDGSQSRQANGSLKGDWRLALGGTSILTLRDAELLFTDSGSLKYKIDPSKIELPEIMAFVTEKLAPFLDSSSGLSFGAIPGGYRCLLDLPIPDMQGVTSGVTGLRLGASLALLFQDGFQIQVGCSLGRPEAPFSVAFFVIGGGGYLQTSLTYTPDKGSIVFAVSLAVTASASIALSLGPIHGGVFIYLGITANFSSAGNSNSFGVVYIIRGEVCLAGIISAFVSLSLSATYSAQSGTLTGIGRLVVRIKICWCFTFEIDQSVTYTLKNGGVHKAQIPSPRTYLASLSYPEPWLRHPAMPGSLAAMDAHAVISDSMMQDAPASAAATAPRKFLETAAAAKRYVSMLV